MAALREILIGNEPEEEKDEFEVDEGTRQKINKAMRDHELSTDTKKDRAKTVSYYHAHNTTRLRTEERKIANYECELVSKDDDHPTIQATKRLTNKYGILITAPKSVYKTRGIREWMFQWLDHKYGIQFGDWSDELIHYGDQHVMVPFIATIKFYLFALINHRLFQNASKIFHTTAQELHLDLMLLTDSKTSKNSGETRLTMVLAKFHTILSDKIELSDFVEFFLRFSDYNHNDIYLYTVHH